jgi:isoaspartyl peptidase/L-asparaginase-like protein (Ntn-hydrolase superfamily)
VAALVQGGTDIETAGLEALDQIRELQFSGGLIAVDGLGNLALPYITQIMPRGVWRDGLQATAWVL